MTLLVYISDQPHFYTRELLKVRLLPRYKPSGTDGPLATCGQSL